MTELQHYKELSLKVFLGLEVVFRPGILLKAPNIKTIGQFGERYYLEICSYLPKLREVVIIEPQQGYQVIKGIFNNHKEISVADFYNFLALFFVDELDLLYTDGVKLWRNGQCLIIKPTDLGWLFNLILLISGTFNRERNDDNPINEQAARILDKIKKAKEKKAKEAAADSNRNPFEIIRSMLEMLAIGHGYKIEELKEYNLFQLMSLGARAKEKETYDTHLAFSMIPMVDHSKDKPFDYWMKNFKYNIGVDDKEPEKELTEEEKAKAAETMTVDSVDFTKAMTVTEDNSDEFE